MAVHSDRRSGTGLVGEMEADASPAVMHGRCDQPSNHPVDLGPVAVAEPGRQAVSWSRTRADARPATQGTDSNGQFAPRRFRMIATRR
ncbi:hypothetical protein [Streptomyces sp. NPDC094032]|uniref:hypothetical protein n=1 Tax=Streptomyces sp. NPDC094032 TaxID=3155308 RepID=UPI00332C9579